MAIQNAKINADVMEPKLCKAANNREVITIANFVGTNKFILFNITPLKINSSLIGETTIIAITPNAKLKELFKYIEEIGKLTKKFKLGKAIKIKFARYKKPYDKNMFKITTKRMDFIESFKKTSFKSSFKDEKEFLSLKIK